MIPSALLRQSITIRARVGEGASGPLYGDPVAYPARIEPRRRQLRDAAGALIVSEAVAWLRPDAAAVVGDRALLAGRELTVLAAAELQGLTRAELLELTLGEAGGAP